MEMFLSSTGSFNVPNATNSRKSNGALSTTIQHVSSYQEMIAHIPLASHPNPKKVLVIGGGDGGVVREVLKHASVEHVVLCDIDEVTEATCITPRSLNE